ncbi:HIV Tat-specific factor 1 homolog [Nematostella vectensis]|uniref:HIV Tat-specific factor 1 homolog n=1 Tax=Nematostella vectensis TaxID=45351 RepID=UPI0020778E2D|nr:HIV Tat-specific factor 1 homolog [Nematostella vectensis]
MGDDTPVDTREFVEELKKQASLVSESESGDVSSDRQSWAAGPGDTSGYEWDPVRQGWFPKVDEDFIASYQLSYGFTSTEEQNKMETTTNANDTTSSPNKQLKAVHAGEKRVVDSSTEENASGEQPDGKKKKTKEEGWFQPDPEKNPNVYVSGLPLDITDEEFVELMSKYGIIMEDPDTQKPKIKLYRDEEGKPKGDGRCCYLKMASVHLAIDLLDEAEYKKSTLHVEQAQFNMKGNYNPALKKKKKKKKKKQGKQQEKLLDWVDRDNRRPKNERVIVIKNMFDPKVFEKDPQLIITTRNDLRKECEKFGDVRKVIVFDRHSEGICSVAFKEHPPADACLERMNGRWFAGRRLAADRWDGVSNFNIQESDKDLKDRMANWEKFLYGEEDEEKSATSTATPQGANS